MKSRLKRKLAALLAFVMIATSVMPAMAEMDLEVLPEKETTVEMPAGTAVTEIAADVNETEEIETGAAETPDPVVEAEEAADTVEEKESEVTPEAEAKAEVVDEVIAVEPAEETKEESTEVKEAVIDSVEEIGEVTVDGVTVEEVVEDALNIQSVESAELLGDASGKIVITPTETVCSYYPSRPAWIMSHHCNDRGEITGKYNADKWGENNVKRSGCNAIEVDIALSDTPVKRTGNEPGRKYLGSHSYTGQEQIFLNHSKHVSGSELDKLMTLSELFEDVREIHPQITIIYLDIKPELFTALK